MTPQKATDVTDNRASILKVAAIQARSTPGDVEANIHHATPLVEQAAAQGARVVVLPELFSCGYQPNKHVWTAAEPRDGPTARWLMSLGRRLDIYVGAGGVESDGADIFNVFLLANPRGEIAGRAYKANAEANVFKRGRREHVIETPIGRIGIGICADNQFASHLRLMHERKVNVILMPHAWPTPFRAAGAVSEADVAGQQRRLVELPLLSARSLGIPVVFVNQIGPLLSVGGILGRLMAPDTWRLQGHSRIVDSDGSLLAALDDQEGVLVATVSLDPACKRYEEPQSYGGWLQPGPTLVRIVIIPLDTIIGRLSYAISRERKQMARARADKSLAPRRPAS
jgi:N-carbamoylputrescine amidase